MFFKFKFRRGTAVEYSKYATVTFIENSHVVQYFGLSGWSSVYIWQYHRNISPTLISHQLSYIIKISKSYFLFKNLGRSRDCREKAFFWIKKLERNTAAMTVSDRQHCSIHLSKSLKLRYFGNLTMYSSNQTDCNKYFQENDDYTCLIITFVLDSFLLRCTWFDW